MQEEIVVRRQNRIKLRGYIADIFDGTAEHDAIVVDVSFEGLCLTELSNRFVVGKKSYDAVVSGGPDADLLKLQVKLRWVRRHGTFLEAGFVIIRPPTKWKKFIRTRLPKEELL